MFAVSFVNIMSKQGEVRIRQLKDPNPGIREHAAKELGGLKSPDAVEPLIAALGDNDQRVRGAAATALGQIGDPRAFQPLLAGFKADAAAGKYEPAKQEAEALGGMGSVALEPLMAALKDKDLHPSAEQGLTRMGAPAVQPLIEVLKDKDGEMRVRAAYVLGDIKDPRADDALIALLNDPDFGIRETAARALVKINDPRAVNFLLNALRNHDNYIVRLVSFFYIERGDPGSEDALIEALNKAGDSSMATEFLNCGNEKLRDAARAWAGENHYEVHLMPGSRSTAWGSKH